MLKPRESNAPEQEAEALGAGRSVPYRLYVLVVLLIANILNYADRSILSVLAEAIKRDLKITDAQLGFLAGTSYVLFYAIIGLAMGRVVDLWRRNRLLSIGVALWSAMTALSGLAGSFYQLCATRLGIGVGETTIGTAGYSLLTDIFPPRWRAVAFSVFICGPFVALALCLAAGGWVVQNWPHACAGLGLCALRGWQAAFVAFGLPGVIVAVLVALIGEPARGAAAERRAKANPWAEGAAELSLLVPPFTFVQLWRFGGARALGLNLAAALVLSLTAAALVWLTKDLAQWAAVAFGSYALFSWSHALAYRDRDMYGLTLATGNFHAMIWGAVIVASLYGAITFWCVPLAIRKLGMHYGEAGAQLGAAIGPASLAGNFLGGFVSDFWRRRDKAAPLYIMLICMVVAAVFLALIVTTSDKLVYVAAVALCVMMLAAWVPGYQVLLQEYVLPAMRGRTAAFYLVATSLIGGSIGAYTVGKISDAFGSLRGGLSVLYLIMPLGAWLLVRAARGLPAAAERRDSLGRRLAEA